MKIKTSFKVDNGEGLYFVAFVIYLFVMISRQSFLGASLGFFENTIYKAILFLCMILLLMKEYITCKLSLVYILYALIIAFLILVIKSVESFAFAFSIMIVFSARDIPFEKVAKIALYVSIITLLVIIGLSLTGIITNYQFDMGTIRPREFLGFYYALYAPAIYLNILLLELYIRRGRTSLLIIMLELVFNIWLFKKTDSRLSFYFSMMIIVITLAFRMVYISGIRIKERIILRYSMLKAIIKICVIFMFLLTAIIGIYLNVNYDSGNRLLNRINYILGQRLRYGQLSYNKYGFGLLGQKLSWVGHGLSIEGKEYTGFRDFLYVDNLYLQVLQKYGLIFFALGICILTFAVYKIYKDKNWMLLFILMIIAGHALLDDLVFYLAYNTFWIAIAPYIFGSHNLNKNNELIRNQETKIEYLKGCL